jgi:tRNA-dihydrouridine synthase 4
VFDRHYAVPFRHLVSLYDVHITHTPMILAAEFSRSSVARHADFTTSREERGIFYLREKGTHGKPRQRRVRGSLIAQFAAHDPKLFADACELIHPHVDGIDLNSGILYMIIPATSAHKSSIGCPQTWAYRDKIGCWLLRQPNQVWRFVISSDSLLYLILAIYRSETS